MTQPIALVVSDVDGTLTNYAGAISPATQREIRRVMRRGVHFSIATGRPTRDLQRVREALDLALPVIVSNGTIIKILRPARSCTACRLRCRSFAPCLI